VNDAHPAQPDNLPQDEMTALLDRTIAALANVRAILQGKKTRALKDDVRRTLSGVLADVEVIRLAL
jgi:hypothetical protein